MSTIREYIEKEGIEKVLDHVVTKCTKERAKDPLTFMANEMTSMTKAEIIGVKRRWIMDPDMVPSMNIEVTTHKGTFEGRGARAKSTSIHQRDPEYRDGVREDFGGQNVKGLMTQKETEWVRRRLGDMREEDQRLRESTRYVNERLPMSVALCKANAREKGLSVHAYIRKHLLSQQDDDDRITMPRLVFEVYNIPNVGIVYICPLETPKPDDLDTNTNNNNHQDIFNLVYRVTKDLQQTNTRNGLYTLEHVFDRLANDRGRFQMGVKIQTEGTWYEERRASVHVDYIRWMEKYGDSLLFIEDPFDESESYEDCMKRMAIMKTPSSCALVWSRYIASDVERLGKWLSMYKSTREEKPLCGAGVCIRLHETGLITEAVDSIRMTKKSDNTKDVVMVMMSVETEGYEGNGRMVEEVARGAGVGYLKVKVKVSDRRDE